MEPSTNIVSSTTAEQASPAEVVRDPFTIYIQSYLTRQGLDETFIHENISFQVILDSFRDIQDTDVPPAPSGPRNAMQYGAGGRRSPGSAGISAGMVRRSLASEQALP